MIGKLYMRFLTFLALLFIRWDDWRKGRKNLPVAGFAPTGYRVRAKNSRHRRTRDYCEPCGRDFLMRGGEILIPPGGSVYHRCRKPGVAAHKPVSSKI